MEGVKSNAIKKQDKAKFSHVPKPNFTNPGNIWGSVRDPPTGDTWQPSAFLRCALVDSIPVMLFVAVIH